MAPKTKPPLGRGFACCKALFNSVCAAVNRLGQVLVEDKEIVVVPALLLLE
jgi:hypothetical protein